MTLVGEHGTLELDSPFRATGPATGRLEIDGSVEVLSLPSDDCSAARSSTSAPSSVAPPNPRYP
jgi:hypothetical protein